MPSVIAKPSLGAALAAIAAKDVNKLEASRNRAPWIQKYWPATDYPEGHTNREPYCAAAVCYWISEWLKAPEVLANLGMTAAQAERWRCKSPRAWAHLDWARAKGVQILSDAAGIKLQAGDLIVFDFSHIGMVESQSGNTIYTIEANTNAAGSREGDGCFRKIRQRSMARAFIRLVR